MRKITQEFLYDLCCDSRLTIVYHHTTTHVLREERDCILPPNWANFRITDSALIKNIGERGESCLHVLHILYLYNIHIHQTSNKQMKNSYLFFYLASAPHPALPKSCLNVNVCHYCQWVIFGVVMKT